MEVVNTTSTANPMYMYNYLNGFVLNPVIFIILLLILVFFGAFSYSLANRNTITTSSSGSTGSVSRIIGILVVIILVVLLVVHAFQYFFSINVTAYVQGLFTSNPKIDIVVDESKVPPGTSVPEIKLYKQVFNIPGNYYDYENAKAVCQAYGADLASYNQMEKAYNNGAEWCNYGWSANQLALFPTQQKTYDTLQTIPGHANDCGRPGINGGFIANPNVKFGVNCYGYKPKITEEEEELMKTYTPYPETVQDVAFQKRVDFWKKKVDDILVSPFNYNNWIGRP
jgi:hypothetical protein